MKNKKLIICLSILVIMLILGTAIVLNTTSKSIFIKSISENNEKEKAILSQNEGNIILNVTRESSYKTGDIEELYNDSAVVVIADYIEDTKTEIKYNEDPTTYSLFKIKKIIKNESGVNLNDEITVKINGGIVKLQELLSARSQEFAKKLGVDNISEEDLKTGLVKFSNNNLLGDKELNEHKTRLLMLNYDKTDNAFVVMQDDYGMLSYDEKNNTAFDIYTKKYITYSFLSK